MEVRNTTDRALDLPSGGDVLESGASGRQYATGSPGGDSSWFFGVTVEPGQRRTLKLALDGSGEPDRVTLTMPKAKGLGLPLTSCSISSEPAEVAWGR